MRVPAVVAKRFLSLFLAVLFCFPLMESAHADKIILKNGKIIRGRVVKDEPDNITILTPSISIILQKDDIKAIERDKALSQDEVLGDIALEDNQYDEALAFYLTALDSGKNKESILEKVAKIREIRKEEVKRRFGSQLSRCDRFIKEKDFDGCEALLKQILSDLTDETLAKPVKEKLAHLYYQKALEYLNTVDEIKAEECLKQAIATSEDSFEAHLMYADLLSRNPRTYDQALEHYLKGIETGDKTLSREPKSLYHRKVALILEHKRLLEEAIKHHRIILDLNPISYPDTKDRIVNAYLFLAQNVPEHDFPKRREYFQAAINTDPYSSRALFNLAMLYYNNDMIDEALSECHKLVELNPKMPELHYYQAMCFLKKRMYDRAKESLERELAINPYNYGAMCALGDYLLNGGQYEQAISYYESARDISKEKYHAYIGLARAYRKLEKPVKARMQLDQVFLTNPDHIEATILSGSLYKDAKNHRKARELFDNVFSRLKEKSNIRRPDQKNLLIEALNQRGELNLILDSPRIALADFKESLEYEPDYPETHYMIAQANIKLGKYPEAEKDYFKAQSLDPKNPKYYLGLGIMYHNDLKKTQKAIENYTKYIELGGEDFDKVNEWIKECGGQPVQPKIE